MRWGRVGWVFGVESDDGAVGEAGAFAEGCRCWLQGGFVSGGPIRREGLRTSCEGVADEWKEGEEDQEGHLSQDHRLLLVLLRYICGCARMTLATVSRSGRAEVISALGF